MFNLGNSVRNVAPHYNRKGSIDSIEENLPPHIGGFHRPNGTVVFNRKIPASHVQTTGNHEWVHDLRQPIDMLNLKILDTTWGKATYNSAPFTAIKYDTELPTTSDEYGYVLKDKIQQAYNNGQLYPTEDFSEPPSQTGYSSTLGYMPYLRYMPKISPFGFNHEITPEEFVSWTIPSIYYPETNTTVQIPQPRPKTTLEHRSRQINDTAKALASYGRDPSYFITNYDIADGQKLVDAARQTPWATAQYERDIQTSTIPMMLQLQAKDSQKLHDIHTQIATIKQQLTTNPSNAADLNTQLSRLNQQANSLNKQLTEYQKNITSAQQAINDNYSNLSSDVYRTARLMDPDFEKIYSNNRLEDPTYQIALAEFNNLPTLRNDQGDLITNFDDSRTELKSKYPNLSDERIDAIIKKHTELLKENEEEHERLLQREKYEQARWVMNHAKRGLNFKDGVFHPHAHLTSLSQQNDPELMDTWKDADNLFGNRSRMVQQNPYYLYAMQEWETNPWGDGMLPYNQNGLTLEQMEQLQDDFDEMDKQWMLLQKAQEYAPYKQEWRMHTA